MSIELGSPEQAFARGGNRLCFIDPDNSTRCIKVLRPDRSPAVRRARKGFPKNLKPLSRFDDNREEYQVMQTIEKTIGAAAYDVVPRCYGFVDTNYGPGLVSDLIVDDNQLISISLKQYIWESGISGKLTTKLEQFCRQWSELGMPSRDLLLHNIVVQQSGEDIKRLVVIDGLGWAGMAAFAYYLPALAKQKARGKVQSLYRNIDRLLEKRAAQGDYGYHGWLNEDKRSLTP